MVEIEYLIKKLQFKPAMEVKPKMADPTIQELVKEIQALKDQVAKGQLPATADLNNDGVVSPAEQAVYNIFSAIIEKTQKNALWTNVLIVIFCVLSFLFSVLGVNL